MAMKIRVMASHGPLRRGLVPFLVYRAEAYDESDRFREPTWGCAHDHESVEHAFNCGVAWLNGQSDESAVEMA
ncbi:MAG: hypothetical protein E6I81_02545 [Chloroflexi bacterium]|nr:MAG: hypothetical protein E6I89_08135 [Chloroflexota bacterium]TMD73941.1 MAG: hypothetical protein E6I81_02545 [Chloroflexota bacterium]